MSRITRNVEVKPVEVVKLWMKVRQAAEYLDSSQDFIRDCMRNGLPFYKVNHTIFIKVKDLDRFIENGRVI